MVTKSKTDTEAGPVSTALETAPIAPKMAVAVTGPDKGRWRIGRKFGPETVLIPLDDLTEDQKAALAGDRKLAVHVVELPPEEDPV